MIAEDEGRIREMIKNLKKYVDEKGLKINVKKTKVMRYKKKWKKMEESKVEMERKS